MSVLRFRPAFLALLLVACDRSAPATKRDSTAVQTPAGTTPAAATAQDNSWNRDAGPLLLVQGESAEEAIVVLPSDNDSAAVLRQLPASHASLFGRGGLQLSAQFGMAAREREPECRVWPLQLGPGHAGDTWAVGFMGGTVQPIPMDSIEMLSSRDSMALAAEASRLASSATAATGPSFEGLRFVAHDVRRFELSPGVHALVAHLIRRVNQEANPQEEQTLIIAERDSGVTTGPYQLVYADRSSGLEEQVVSPEVIAGLRVGGRPTLIIARDSEAGVSYVLLERTGLRQWKVRWVSAPTRCA